MTSPYRQIGSKSPHDCDDLMNWVVVIGRNLQAVTVRGEKYQSMESPRVTSNVTSSRMGNV